VGWCSVGGFEQVDEGVQRLALDATGRWFARRSGSCDVHRANDVDADFYPTGVARYEQIAFRQETGSQVNGVPRLRAGDYARSSMALSKPLGWWVLP
jgi:hypothetical protein